VPVTASRIILAGRKAFENNQEKITMLRVMGGSNYIKYMEDSAARWAREKKPLVVEPRVRLAHDLLKQSLNDPRTTDLKVFD
jgi:hypothetical protein